MLFLRVDAFLSSKVGIVQQAACTSQLFAESILRGGLKWHQPIISLYLKQEQLPSYRRWMIHQHQLRSVVFLLQVVIYHATNPDTPFVVTETSFSDLRDKTEDEVEDMLEVLKKQLINEFPNGKGITCFYSGIEVVPLTHAGSAMLSFHQGNPTLKSDDPGQTWQITTWFMNCYK
jgi:hypothetical protein